MAAKKNSYIFINSKTLVSYHKEYMTEDEVIVRNEWVRKNAKDVMKYVTEEEYDELLHPRPADDSDYEYHGN